MMSMPPRLTSCSLSGGLGEEPRGKVGQNGQYAEIARGIHREEYEQTLALARELGLRLDPRVLGRRSDERANRGVSFWSSSGFEKEAVMADTVRRVEYYYVTVPDVPGEGQRILSALKDDGVNLLAFLGFPLGGGQSQIDLVPEDPRSLSEAAERAGVTLSEAKRAFLIQGDDRVGAVAETMAKLAQASINLTAAAATGAGAGRYGMILWVAPADYERAAAALGAQ